MISFKRRGVVVDKYYPDGFKGDDVRPTVFDPAKPTQLVQYGADMMEEVIAEPTLDRYLDRAPKLLEPTDYEQLVKLLHRKREMFIKAEADKKAGIKTEEKTDAQIQDD